MIFFNRSFFMDRQSRSRPFSLSRSQSITDPDPLFLTRSRSRSVLDRRSISNFKFEFFNKVLNKLLIYIPNINNTIKQVLPKNILKLKKQVKNLFRKSKTNLQYKYNWIEAKKNYPKNLIFTF